MEDFEQKIAECEDETLTNEQLTKLIVEIVSTLTAIRMTDDALSRQLIRVTDELDGIKKDLAELKS